MPNKVISKAIKDLDYITRRYRKVNSPIFWIFLDNQRINNFEFFLSSIPKKLKVGIIFRSKNNCNEYNNIKRLLKECKKKKFLLKVADDPLTALSLGAYGVHFSRNTRFAKKYYKLKYSCSVHGLNDKRRVVNLGTDLVFISPLFKTTSSKSKKPLGLIFLGILSKYLSIKYGAIGGIDFDNVRLLKGRNINTLGGLTYISRLLRKFKC